MIVLKNIEQIKEQFSCFVCDGEAIDFDVENFISRDLSDEELKEIASKVADLSNKLEEVEEFSLLIFQLRDYMPSLSNFTKILLLTKNYIACYHFVTKLFVNQIGNIKYSSTNPNLTFIQRYFDKFIEIAKNCKISPELYLPLLTETLKPTAGVLLNWKEPAIEYLQSFYNKSEDWVVSYLKTCSSEVKYNLLKGICEFNTARGLALILDDMPQCDEDCKKLALSLLKNYEKDVLLIVDKNYAVSSMQNKTLYIEILLEFLPDNDALTRLKEIYEDESDEALRAIISRQIGATDTLAIKTEKQFLYACRRKMKEPQERALGVVFEKQDLTLKSGFACDNSIYSFVVFLLKEEKNLVNLKKLLVLNDIFVPETLQHFARNIFNSLCYKDDILQAKWAIRFFSLFASDEDKNVYKELLVKLYKENRIKEARYFSECLIYAGQYYFIDVLKLLIKEGNVLDKDLQEELINKFASVNDISKEQLDDDLIADEWSNEAESLQIARLKEAFVNAREYSEERFAKIFIENKFMNSLACRLVWGEYNFGRLYNTFIIKNGQIVYITKTLDLTEKVVKIVHSLDMDSRFDGALFALDDPLFIQFKATCFNVNDFTKMSVSVNRFNGMFVSTKAFCEYMTDNGFIINKTEDELLFESLIFINNEQSVIAEVNFEKPCIIESEFTTLGSIYFYKLNDIVSNNGKYLTQKSSAISISGLEPRFFDYILSTVSMASKLK